MTPEEIKQDLINHLDIEIWNTYVQPNFTSPNPGLAYEIAEVVYEAMVVYLEEHQPIAAKLFAEGDPEGPLADAIRYGLVKSGGIITCPRECDENPCTNTCAVIDEFRINYPEEVKK